MELVLKEINKSYNKAVLKNLELQLSGYGSIGIIGKSGCGKSTLLRLLAGIEQADGGEIIVDGKKLVQESIREHHHRIGMVFQQHNLFPHLTLLKNITLILEKVRGVEKEQAEKTGKALLQQLHLTEEMYKRPNEVSGGQTQRAAIARALATNPELIIMDEPTAALDPILTKEVLEAVSELKDSGRQFIFVTHEIKFAKEFADYIIFMDEGYIIEHGTIDILDKPKTDTLRQFLVYER